MATLKDFSKGSKAYIVDNTWKRATKITECTVKSSGRKYVVVDLGIGENPATFESGDLTDYLLEYTDEEVIDAACEKLNSTVVTIDDLENPDWEVLCIDD